MKTYFGDLHNHCGITYGFGSLENARSAGDRPAPRPPWPAYPDFRQWNRPHRQRPFSAENSAAACWR